MLLNNECVNNEVKEKTNENENTTTQNLGDTRKAILRGKFIELQAYLKKQGRAQINNLTSHLKGI